MSKNVEKFRRNRNYNEDDYEFFYEKKKMKKKPSRKSFYNENYHDYDNEYQKSTRKRYRQIDWYKFGCCVDTTTSLTTSSILL